MSIRRIMLFTLGGFFKSIISLFKTRVLNDGGTFEAETNLENQLNTLGSDLFDSASLVITPNGVKTSKLYTIKPNDGTGDLTVIRNTSATRIDESGNIVNVPANVARIDYSTGQPAILVEPQRTNLALRSNEFSFTNWILDGATVSNNVLISPSRTLDADLITCITQGITSSLNQTISIPSGSATLSVFAKAGNYNIFRIGNVLSSQRGAWFDLSTGSVIGTVNGGTARVENYGNGWFRCIFTATSFASGTNAFNISISSGANLTTGVVGANIYLWGAQLEAGSNATSYIPTTTSAVTRNADVISKNGLIGISEITETFENGTTNVISGNPTSYTMSQGRIKQVIGL